MKGLRILAGIAAVAVVTVGVLSFGQVEAPALPPPVTLRAGTSPTTPHLNDLVIVPPPVYDPQSSLHPGNGSVPPISAQSADSPDDVTTTTTFPPVGADSESLDSPDEDGPDEVAPSAPPADEVDESDHSPDSIEAADSVDSPDGSDSLDSPDD